MNTKELECFLAVCEEKSIHKAADKMFISVQGMSRIIKKLEAEVGAAILHRTPQGVQLTGEGEILERHAVSIIDNISNMSREIKKSAGGMGGSLSVGISYGLLSFYRPSVIVDFKNENPEIELEFKEYSDVKVTESVWLGASDVALVYEPVDMEQFDVTPLNSGEFFMVVHKDNPLSRKAAVTIEDIKGQPLVLQNEEFNIHKLVVSECGKKGFTPDIVFQSTGICMCNRLCKENKGISVATKNVINEIKSDDVLLIPFAGRPYHQQISAITRKGNMITGEMKAFIDFMKLRAEEIEETVAEKSQFAVVS